MREVDFTKTEKAVPLRHGARDKAIRATVELDHFVTLPWNTVLNHLLRRTITPPNLPKAGVPSTLLTGLLQPAAPVFGDDGSGGDYPKPNRSSAVGDMRL